MKTLYKISKFRKADRRFIGFLSKNKKRWLSHSESNVFLDSEENINKVIDELNTKHNLYYFLRTWAR